MKCVTIHPHAFERQETEYTLRRIVESTGAQMFGLDDAEVTERRRYVGRVRREIQVRF